MREKLVIADSSILICFAKAKRLNILKDLAGKITVPKAVYKEITEEGKPGIEEILTSGWIETKLVKDRKEVNRLPYRLGKGEKEAIILTKELDGFLLIDDFFGRKEAERLGIKFTGSLGILQEAKAANIISKVKPILDDLISSGLRLHPRLYKEFLEKIGE